MSFLSSEQRQRALRQIEKADALLAEDLANLSEHIGQIAERRRCLRHNAERIAAADERDCGAAVVKTIPEPSLVWSALTIEERRQREAFWKAVATVLCAVGLSAACVFAACSRERQIGTNMPLPPYSIDEETGEVIR